MSRKGADKRVIAHIDMDCFYVQVEAGLDPSLVGVPCAVVQYNPFGELKTYHYTDNRKNISQNGGIIAVNYEARALGVKRHMRGGEASKACPSVQLVQVPTTHGKADITVYRKAGEEVVRVLSSLFSCPVEKASIDEVYLDLTEECRRRLQEDDYLLKTVPLARSAAVLLPSGTLCAGDGAGPEPWMRDGLGEEDQLLVCGAAAAQELRTEILKQLGYTCSAGVAHNKMLAKIASSSHKPNKQAIIPSESVSFMMNALPIQKIPGYGGKLGEAVKAALGVETVGDLRTDPNGLSKLVDSFGAHQGHEIWKTLSGINDDEVKERAAQSIISCGKQFPDKLALTGAAAWQPGGDVDVWVKNLVSELCGRLADDKEQHGRAPKVVGVSVNFKLSKPKGGGEAKHMSESGAMPATPSQVEGAIGGMLRNLLSAYVTNTAGALAGVESCFSGLSVDKKLSADDVCISSLFVKASSFQALPEEKERITRFFNVGGGGSAFPSHSPSKIPPRQCDEASSSAVRSPIQTSPGGKGVDIKNYFSKREGGDSLQRDSSDLKHKKLSAEAQHDSSQVISSSGNNEKCKSKINSYFGEPSVHAEGASTSRPGSGATDLAVHYNGQNVDIDVLEALPEDVRNEILNDICAQAERQRQTQGSGALASQKSDLLVGASGKGADQRKGGNASARIGGATGNGTGSTGGQQLKSYFFAAPGK